MDGFLTGTGVAVGKAGSITTVGVGLGKGVAVGSGSGSGTAVGSSVGGGSVGSSTGGRAPNRLPGTTTRGVDTGPEGWATGSWVGNGGKVGAG